MGAIGVAGTVAGKTGPKRHDPRHRHVDSAPRWSRIVNQDPKFKYVYVSQDDTLAIQQYKYDGYTSVPMTESGARPMGGATVQMGQEQTAMGMLLMQVPIERWEQIQREGPEGGKGAERATWLESQMLKAPGREWDPSRGRHGNRRHRPSQGLEVVNDSEIEGAED